MSAIAGRPTAKAVGVCAALTLIAGLVTFATKESGAYWVSTANGTAQTVTTGTLALTANGSHSVALPGLTSTAMNPGDSLTSSVTLANGGNSARLNWWLSSATSSNSAYLTLTAWTYSSAYPCVNATTAPTAANGLLTASSTIPATPPGALSSTATQVVCLRGTISSSATTTGATYTGSFTFSAQQSTTRS